MAGEAGEAWRSWYLAIPRAHHWRPTWDAYLAQGTRARAEAAYDELYAAEMNNRLPGAPRYTFREWAEAAIYEETDPGGLEACRDPEQSVPDREAEVLASMERLRAMEFDDNSKTELEHNERWLDAMMRPAESGTAAAKAREAVRVALDEEWLGEYVTPLPSATTVARVKASVRNKLVAGRPLARYRIFGALSAAAGILAASQPLDPPSPPLPPLPPRAAPKIAPAGL